ncbi:MAG: hypothetical protein WDM84_07575 [Bauldia sp.]
MRQPPWPYFGPVGAPSGRTQPSCFFSRESTVVESPSCPAMVACDSVVSSTSLRAVTSSAASCPLANRRHHRRLRPAGSIPRQVIHRQGVPE